MTALGALLRRYREAAGLSQEELAERAGVSARGVSDLERGLRRSPYPATVRRLAQALDLGPEDRAVLLAAAHPNSSVETARPGPGAEPGGYLGAPPASGLVGRQREVGELMSALEAALRGSGRLVLLNGDAGIGKTRLSQQLASMATGGGWLVATGRCYAPQQGVAFYPFLDALSSLYVRAPASVREAIPHRWPYLQRLLPDAFPVPDQTPGDTPDELQRLLRAATAFVRACAASAPVALLVDDLQWADRASLELLEHLLRHTRGDAVLIGGTAREPDLSSAARLRRGLVDLQREGLLHRIPVEPLDRAGIAALLVELLGTGQPSGALIDLIHAATEGNPFFAIELLQTLRTRGEVLLRGGQWMCQGGPWVAVPDTVRESVLERYAHLSPASAASVDAAAVLGQTFRVEEVAAVVSEEPEAVESALLEAVRAGFVRAPGVEDRWAFVHALSQQALYERVPPHRRRQLHLRAADALEGLPARPREGRTAELAQHLQQAGVPARALPYLVLAGDQAEAVFAHHEAADRYRAASRVAAEVDDRCAEAQALLRLGQSLLRSGQPEDALEHFEAAVRTYSALDDAEGEGEALARIAQVYFARGNWDAGVERLPALIERLEQRQPSRALALLYACLAMVLPAEPDARARAAARASELARELGDQDLLVQAEARRGFVLMLAGRLPEARAALETILPLAEARRVYDALPIILGVLSEVAKLQGDARGHLELSRREVARAEEAGDPVALVGALSGVAEAEFLLGDWAAARRTYARAAGQASGLDAAWYEGFVQLGVAAIDVAQGNWDAAEQQLAQCLVDSPRLGHQNRREHALRLLAQRELLGDQAASALARLDEVVSVEGAQHAGTQALRAWALLKLGDAARAADTVARAVDLARAQRNRLDLFDGLLVQGEVERRIRKVQAADTTLEEALALALGMPCPYAEARARYARARLFADVGRVTDARQELERARAIFVGLGARPYLHKAERLATALADQAGAPPKPNSLPSSSSTPTRWRA